MSWRFLGNVLIRGQIECLTGLHIGGSDQHYEIGGMDNPVIRDPVSEYPYIPGSSLKGKLRSISEWANNCIDIVENNGTFKAGVHSCGRADCPICSVYGTANQNNKASGPTRLIVRDAYPNEATKRVMNELKLDNGLPMVEVKYENSLDRLTSVANPRPVERVTAGSVFDMSMTYSVYEYDGDSGSGDVQKITVLLQAMRLLEDAALGGGGSRGSGRVRLMIEEQPYVRTAQSYSSGFADLPLGDLVSVTDVDVDTYSSSIGTSLRS